MISFIANKIMILSYNLQGSDRLCNIKLKYQVGFIRPRLLKIHDRKKKCL